MLFLLKEPPKTHEPPPYHFTAFEALAASGLRSIRYAMEIPLLKSVNGQRRVATRSDYVPHQVHPHERSI